MIRSSATSTVVFALGANLGDPLAALRRAAARLATELHGARASAVYETPPEGGVDQPPYLNAVVAGEAAMTPEGALALARHLEAEAGRERTFPGAPRSLDVDVLFVGDRVVREPDLCLPHPRWRARDFVVVPLLDVAAEMTDPESGIAVREVARTRGWDRCRFPIVLAPGALLGGTEP